MLLRDLESGDLVFTSTSTSENNKYLGMRVPSGKGIAGRVALTGEELVVNDVSEHPDFFSGIDESTSFKTRNIICMPMVVLDDLVGVIEIVNSTGQDHFTTSDVEKARYIASQAAIAITNRRLIDDLNSRVQELESLYEISQAVAFSDSMDFLLDRILMTVTGSLGIKGAGVFLVNDDGDIITEAVSGMDNLEHGDMVSKYDSVLSVVYNFGQMVQSTDGSEQVIINFDDDRPPLASSMFMVFPILIDEEVKGITVFNGTVNDLVFSTVYARLAHMINGQITDLIIKSDHQRKVEEQRILSHEIDIAARIQMKALPTIPATFLHHELMAHSIPAKIVGGDFYDFFTHESSSYAVLAADISGKGIPAAVFMGASRSAIRAERMHMNDPETLLFNANNSICLESESAMFITLFYAWIDPSSGKVVYASAGHNNQLLIRSASSTWESLNTKGRALGLVKDSIFQSHSLIAEKGDILCLFTDGVVECLGGEDMDVDGGEDLLAQVLVKMKNKPLDEIKRALDVYHEKSRVPENLKDDFTLVMVRF